MDRESELAAVRRAFAKQVLAAVGVDNPCLEAAFAITRREDFLGPGPWQIFRWGMAYRQTPRAMARQGAVFRIECHGGEFFVKWISAVDIFPCAGNRDEAGERALAAALANGRLGEVTRLYRRTDIPEERCWLRGADWCLAYN